MKIATLCYIKNNGKTLMMHRTKKKEDMHQGKWNGLGGKVHQGETPEECVIREVKEESGLDVLNPLLRGILTFPKFYNEEDWYVFVYTSNQFNGELTDCREGYLHWIEDDKIFDLNLWEGDKYFLHWLNEKGIFSAKFEYINGELIKYNVIFHNTD